MSFYKDIIDEEIPDPLSLYKSQQEMAEAVEQNNELIKEFLGKGHYVAEAFTTDYYYMDLLIWTIRQIISPPEFRIIDYLGNHSPIPIYTNVETDYKKKETCLAEGNILFEQDGIRMVVAIGSSGSVKVMSQRTDGERIRNLCVEIKRYMESHNFYRGKNIQLGGDVSFLNVEPRRWDSIILDPNMKDNIRRNTIGFLENLTGIQSLGIQTKRGIILSGDPGTGKTILCKAIMSDAKGITCITGNAFGEMSSDYISNLYSLAQDLSPSIIFLEDIDFIGQQRDELDRGNPPLLTLLSEMDGIGEKNAIVTVATSNLFETLDKALSERPSRFDCIFQLPRPSVSDRRKLISLYASKIDIGEDIREYIVTQAEGYTPAQIQGIIHLMAITKVTAGEAASGFTQGDVDSSITQVKYSKQENSFGFSRRS